MFALSRGKDEGTFLLRRKDAQTLILSYVGASQIHHVLIEFARQKYHIGSSKVRRCRRRISRVVAVAVVTNARCNDDACVCIQTSHAAFATLWKCLRSVRRYANRGLIFTRNADFRVVNKPELALETGSSGEDIAQPIAETPRVWRTRTRSGSTGSVGDKSSSASSSGGASPSPHKPRRGGRPELQATQQQVQIPPLTRIEELRSRFYEELTSRLAQLAAVSAPPAGQLQQADEVAALLAMVRPESSWEARGKLDVARLTRVVVVGYGNICSGGPGAQ